MSANCEYYQSLMSRMLDGDLTAAEAEALREHIRTCPRCRDCGGAFSAMAHALRDETAEPPASFSQNIMARILPAHAPLQAEPGTPFPRAGGAEARPYPARHRRPWAGAAIAACLVLIIGSAAIYAGRGMFSAQSAGPVYEAAAEEAMDAAAPMEAAQEYDGGNGRMAATPAGDAPMEEGILGEEAAMPDPAEAPMAAAGAESLADTAAQAYTWEHPAYVPAGREADFEALIADAGDMPEADFRVIAAVEYHGVIYEFLTDEKEQYLLWQDAAEGLPVHSPGSIQALWDILE